MLQLMRVSEISESLEVVEGILDLCVGDAADLGKWRGERLASTLRSAILRPKQTVADN